MAYEIAKWLHILSSTVLFGTGFGSAYYMFFASRTGDARTIANVVRSVVIADWLFTTTTIVFQPLSGLYLAHIAQFPLASRWILWSFVLYFVAGACWVPVVFRSGCASSPRRQPTRARPCLPPTRRSCAGGRHSASRRSSRS